LGDFLLQTHPAFQPFHFEKKKPRPDMKKNFSVTCVLYGPYKDLHALSSSSGNDEFTPKLSLSPSLCTSLPLSLTFFLSHSLHNLHHPLHRASISAFYPPFYRMGPNPEKSHFCSLQATTFVHTIVTYTVSCHYSNFDLNLQHKPVN
jgi:hypothetical protein